MDEPILETHEIQGNILPGFNKSHQTLLGVRIVDATAARGFLRALADEVATADEVLRFNQLRRAMIARRGREPTEMAATWVNLAISAPGLAMLGRTDLEQFEDDAFRIGLPERATSLGDPSDAENLEGSPKRWVVGGTEDTIPHLLFIVASDAPPLLTAKVRTLKARWNRVGSGLKQIYEERGKDLPGKLAGHEHFGFKDGISQPGVRGRLPDVPNAFLTPRLIADPQPDGSLPEFAKPGQPLVWPGEFVFGYESQDPTDARAPLRKKPVSPAWARNGTYLVFRRLRQDVAKFREFLSDTVKWLADTPFADINVPQLAAMLVGRWPSGAPIVRSPTSENPKLGRDPFLNNHFAFNGPVPNLHLVSGTRPKGDALDGAPGDLPGLVCPQIAHIRKVNPRDITTEQGSNTDVLQRRILRRGIPFGAPLPARTSAADDRLQGNRGLLFLCYQTSITDQFEFLTRNWMNQADAPESRFAAGFDLLVGQKHQPGQDRERQGTLNRAADLHQKIFARQEWVIPTGGGYFFAPSINALRDVLSAAPT